MDKSNGEDQVNSTSESDPVDIPSSSSRRRNDSESQPSSSSADTEIPKRQRTISSSQLPSVQASPPGFVSLEEIMKAANSVSNMTLAHEIAVDNDFHLKKVEPPGGNGLHKIVKEMYHKAYWDLLREELDQDPPEYQHALTLLEEIKDWLLSLLLPHQTRTQNEIKEKLDIQLIEQQVKSGTLDMHHYSQYIVSLMARLCAPGRDDKIRELTTMNDTVHLYKGIFETLELMRLDMANFTIRQIRPQIVACSVEYERNKFEDYLKITPDGLRNTREWLHRSRESPAGSSGAGATCSDSNHAISCILVDSFMQLLKWQDCHPWPETVAMDEGRFKELGAKLESLELRSSVMLVSLSQCSASLQTLADYRQSLCDHVSVLMSNCDTKEQISKALPNVAAQVIEDTNKALQGLGQPCMTSDQKESLTVQIVDLANPDNRIRKILNSRLFEFLRQVISNEVARPTQIPAGLSLFREDIAAIAGQFARLVSHNRAVHAANYADLIAKHCL